MQNDYIITSAQVSTPQIFWAVLIVKDLPSMNTIIPSKILYQKLRLHYNTRCLIQQPIKALKPHYLRSGTPLPFISNNIIISKCRNVKYKQINLVQKDLLV